MLLHHSDDTRREETTSTGSRYCITRRKTSIGSGGNGRYELLGVEGAGEAEPDKAEPVALPAKACAGPAPFPEVSATASTWFGFGES